MKKIENVYMLLPRFVPQTEVKYEAERYLPAIFRDFERNGMRFAFIIQPATIYDRQTGTKYYYPGAREEIVEAVLREQAVEENPNFIKNDLALIFRLNYFLDFITESGYGSYTSNEIELSLQILSLAQFELHKNKTELTFRAIEELNHVIENDEVYYYVRFNYMFLGDNKIFDHCFGGANPNKSRSGK